MHMPEAEQRSDLAVSGSRGWEFQARHSHISDLGVSCCSDV